MSADEPPRAAEAAKDAEVRNIRVRYAGNQEIWMITAMKEEGRPAKAVPVRNRGRDTDRAVGAAVIPQGVLPPAGVHREADLPTADVRLPEAVLQKDDRILQGHPVHPEDRIRKEG